MAKHDGDPAEVPPTLSLVVVTGTVQPGDQRGRTMGFPTANLALEDDTVADGVWAGWLERADGTRHVAAVSVGRRPTFYGHAGVRLLEAHLPDFDDDLYGEHVAVALCCRLRGQQTFDSIDQLVRQLRADVARTRRWAATAGDHGLLAQSLPSAASAAGS